MRTFIFVLLLLSSIPALAGSVQEICARKMQIAGVLMDAREAGMSKDEYLAGNPITDQLSETVRTWATWIVDEAWKWPRGREDFSLYVKIECLEGRH